MVLRLERILICITTLSFCVRALKISFCTVQLTKFHGNAVIETALRSIALFVENVFRFEQFLRMAPYGFSIHYDDIVESPLRIEHLSLLYQYVLLHEFIFSPAKLKTNPDLAKRVLYLGIQYWGNFLIEDMQDYFFNNPTIDGMVIIHASRQLSLLKSSSLFFGFLQRNQQSMESVRWLFNILKARMTPELMSAFLHFSTGSEELDTSSIVLEYLKSCDLAGNLIVLLAYARIERLGSPFNAAILNNALGNIWQIVKDDKHDLLQATYIRLSKARLNPSNWETFVDFVSFIHENPLVSKVILMRLTYRILKLPRLSMISPLAMNRFLQVVMDRHSNQYLMLVQSYPIIFLPPSYRLLLIPLSIRINQWMRNGTFFNGGGQYDAPIERFLTILSGLYELDSSIPLCTTIGISDAKTVQMSELVVNVAKEILKGELCDRNLPVVLVASLFALAEGKTLNLSHLFTNDMSSWERAINMDGVLPALAKWSVCKYFTPTEWRILIDSSFTSR